MLPFLLAFCFVDTALSDGVNLVNGRVFNPAFYINTNPEVSKQGISSPNDARTHWLNTGLKSGLQACGNFHSKQYLERYPDLKKKFGDNYTAAVEHFLTEGSSQGLLGYVEGGYEGRWTISQGQQDGLFISASSRMGGAVDSVVFDNTEFINAYDHGRELQLAMNMVPNGECYNPTEAGGRDDAQSADTMTKVLSIHSDSRELRSKVFPAFWLRPGDIETGIDTDSNCHNGSKAINTNSNYGYTFAKNVSIGCPGLEDETCFTFNSTVTIGGQLPEYQVLQVEGPTGYHTGEFNTSMSLDVETGELIPYDMTKPLVFSTWCTQHAFGIWAPPGQDTDYAPYYGVAHFAGRGTTFAGATQKWNVVWRKNTLPAESLPHSLHYTVYICVGNQMEAGQCLMDLIKNYNKR